ncbi:hypothetical protein Tco_0308959, partial [Tanacetum coccineum]
MGNFLLRRDWRELLVILLPNMLGGIMQVNVTTGTVRMRLVMASTLRRY